MKLKTSRVSFYHFFHIAYVQSNRKSFLRQSTRKFPTRTVGSCGLFTHIPAHHHSDVGRTATISPPRKPCNLKVLCKYNMSAGQEQCRHDANLAGNSFGGSQMFCGRKLMQKGCMIFGKSSRITWERKTICELLV